MAPKNRCHKGEVDAGAFSPDGKTIAIGTSEGSVRLWDVATGALVGQPISHHGAVSGVAFSPDGKTLVVAGEDDTAQLWDLATRSPAAPPLKHKAWVFTVAFSPDGKTILTGSFDKTARLWDAATGVPIGPALYYAIVAWSVAFSPDGKTILAGCLDNKARLVPIVAERPEPLEFLGPWVEVFTGLSLDARHGTIQVLDNAAWLARRERLEQLGGSPGTGAWLKRGPGRPGPDRSARSRVLIDHGKR